MSDNGNITFGNFKMLKNKQLKWNHCKDDKKKAVLKTSQKTKYLKKECKQKRCRILKTMDDFMS